MARQLWYSVATSLDGFIADAEGGYEWITMDPDIDFAAMMARFDTLIMGRGTYEVAGGAGPGFGKGTKVYVVSTTIDQADHPGVTIISRDVAKRVADIKEEDGKDIWLFGGGVLFRALAEAGLVDRVEVGVIPVLLGQGIPLLPGFSASSGGGATGAASRKRAKVGAAKGAAAKGVASKGAGEGAWLRLRLLGTKEMPKSGIVMLDYAVEGLSGPVKPPKRR